MPDWERGSIGGGAAEGAGLESGEGVEVEARGQAREGEGEIRAGPERAEVGGGKRTR